MTAIAALRLPLDVDLSGFVGVLQRLQVPHRVSEEAGAQVLWVPSEVQAADVRELYRRFPEGDPRLQALVPARRQGRLSEVWATSKMTLLVLSLTLLVAGVTLLGESLATLHWLTFTDFRLQGDYLVFIPPAESLAAGQWWRLFTPMLIHFGILHLAMNSLWYWELGRRIEARQGADWLLALTLLFALLSNAAQYLFGGPSLFGGLSGVLYGLLGYCWIFQRLAPTPAYHLPPGVLVMMLVWLLLCASGLITALGFGSIANAAHIGGLLAGCLAGLLGGALARRHR
ncbi:MAG TPA: rhomboid family intramembrane serine protease [Pseudomonas sp.]|uniref:rhomboid family intramembrane serine protease n=1 Tax=Pseudomonas sp. TaxID=306 RepID=UPI002C596857|nr:rhomboid family intramembrane serine protease [Pseudomonas sp.]HRL95388.1 rhomboid family intramembrane serine protease [Pseudomonas sp.]